MNDTAATQPGQDPVVIQVTVGAPIETVWSFLREPDLIQRWHGWVADGLDSEIDYIYRTHARETERPYVLEMDRGSDGSWVDAGDRFELTESEDPEADGAVGGGGVVTIVRIIRGARGPEEMWDAWYEDITEGWTSFLNQLRFTVELHPEALRRTIFLSADGHGLPSVRAALGLSGVLPGQPYEAVISPELELLGHGWFVSDNQVGATVGTWGPGLVIAADRPDGGSYKGVMAIVTTYGQDDADFTRTVREWQNWWTARYPDSGTAQT